MYTNSVIIRKITAFLAWLNYYFEYSLIYKGFLVVQNAARGSRILGGFVSTEYRDYWQGSLILRLLAFVCGKIILAGGWVVNALARLNETSMTRRVYQFLRKSLILNWLLNLRNAYMLFIVGALLFPAHMWNNMLLLLSAVVFSMLYAVKWAASAVAPLAFSQKCLAKPHNVTKNTASSDGLDEPHNVTSSTTSEECHANPHKTPISFSHISPALLIFVFFCGLSIITGYGGGDSLRVFIILFACVVHSVLVSLIFTKKEDFRMFFVFLAAALALVALYGIYLFMGGIEIREELVDLGVSPGLSRLYSTMGNPNTDAMFWAMVLPFVLAVCVTVKSDTARFLLAAAFAIVLAAFALTYSRSGYVAFMAGVGVFILLTAPRLVPVALFALVLALPFIPAGIIERLFTLGQDSSSRYRFLIWEGTGRMLHDFWVRGIGMGPAAFIRIYSDYSHPLAERAMHSHNTFLDILSHSGIGAFLAFLAYLYRLLRRGIATHFASDDLETKIFISAGIAAIAVFIIVGLGEYVWFYPRVMFVFWVCAGVLGGLCMGKKAI